MKHRLPRTPAEWLEEIKLAIADAREAKPFDRLTGESLTDTNLFHLAPLVCLKFRGRKLRGAEAKQVTETALALEDSSPHCSAIELHVVPGCQGLLNVLRHGAKKSPRDEFTVPGIPIIAMILGACEHPHAFASL